MVGMGDMFILKARRFGNSKSGWTGVGYLTHPYHHTPMGLAAPFASFEAEKNSGAAFQTKPLRRRPACATMPLSGITLKAKQAYYAGL